MTEESTAEEAERGDDEKGFVFGDVDDPSPEETAVTFEEPHDESSSETADDADSIPDDDSADATPADDSSDSLPILEERRSDGIDLTDSERDREGESVDDEQQRREGPLGDLADRIRDRESDEEFDDLFDREDVDGIDHEELWEQVEGTDDPLEDLTVEPEIREIPKGKYCHQCEHFSEPPDVGCHHEGTTILELVDLETFRVADCPVVLKDERLEE